MVIPLGGGGLASGVGLALKAAAPQVTIVGVEVEASTPFTLSLEAGRITEITPRPSLADGLVGNLEPGSMTFPLVKQVVDYVVTVSEDDLAPRHEGSRHRGAADRRRRRRGVGCGDHGRQGVRPGQRVVAIVTGGNVDLPKWLATIIHFQGVTGRISIRLGRLRGGMIQHIDDRVRDVFGQQLPIRSGAGDSRPENPVATDPGST